MGVDNYILQVIFWAGKNCIWNGI